MEAAGSSLVVAALEALLVEARAESLVRPPAAHGASVVGLYCMPCCRLWLLLPCCRHVLVMTPGRRVMTVTWTAWAHIARREGAAIYADMWMMSLMECWRACARSGVQAMTPERMRGLRGVLAGATGWLPVAAALTCGTCDRA